MATEAIKAHPGDMPVAILWFLSRNKTMPVPAASDTECLFEILNPLRDRYNEDLKALAVNPKPDEHNIAMLYPRFMEATKAKELEVSEQSNYKHLLTLLVFMLGLVVALQLGWHHVHAHWFKISTLLHMLKLHGAVSTQAKSRAILTISYHPQIISNFLIHSKDDLECIASPEESPLNCKTIEKIRGE